MTKKKVTTLLDEARAARRANLAQRKLQTEKLALTTKLEKRMAGIIALETEAEREKRRGGKHDFIVVGGMLSAAKDQLHYVDTLDWDCFLDDDDLVRRCAELAGVTGSELLGFVCSKCNPSNLRAMQQAWQKSYSLEALEKYEAITTALVYKLEVDNTVLIRELNELEVTYHCVKQEIENKHEKAIELAKKLARKEVATKAGKASHKENHQLKADIFAYMDDPTRVKKALDDHATDIAEKVVPLKFRTVRKHLTAWNKQRKLRLAQTK